MISHALGLQANPILWPNERSGRDVPQTCAICVKVNFAIRYSCFEATILHELGHNLGLEHANSDDMQYGDIYDVMGNYVSVDHS